MNQMRYFIRSVKYFLYFTLIFVVIIAILVFILAYRQPGPVMVFKTWQRRRAGRWFTGRKAVWS